jgi:hypothetical protein
MKIEVKPEYRQTIRDLLAAGMRVIKDKTPYNQADLDLVAKGGELEGLLRTLPFKDSIELGFAQRDALVNLMETGYEQLSATLASRGLTHSHKDAYFELIDLLTSAPGSLQFKPFR